MNRITRSLARPIGLVAAAVALLLGPSACSPAARVGVTNDFDHAVNFRAFKTWAWYPQQPKDVEGGPAKGYESFLDKRMRAAVAAEMTAKGLTEVTTAPDIYIAYSARVEDKQQVSPYYNGLGYPYGYGYGYYGRGYSPVTQYKAGTVVIDIIDARRKELAWRGTGQAQVDQNTIDEAETHRIVNGILSTYPPQDNNARR
ncbi:DUF4136 domain-containing protein [Hymenobacter properus]|uniref:DUF4136 domain-containing protein n=1 Tax=Hymenobacter properus TaxID=2791026 RepID=A0A931FM47_9BACT|nr:DUF4136 domain-containing protein [Hymenobacter properus]MBF9141329.1 DUF4136 domain-containing protein [Hymenobacter properus]MBR7720139.1 DUF4136 domain-containing protein [Microvirga sp. SRT04]